MSFFKVSNFLRKCQLFQTWPRSKVENYAILLYCLYIAVCIRDRWSSAKTNFVYGLKLKLIPCHLKANKIHFRVVYRRSNSSTAISNKVVYYMGLFSSIPTTKYKVWSCAKLKLCLFNVHQYNVVLPFGFLKKVCILKKNRLLNRWNIDNWQILENIFFKLFQTKVTSVLCK